MKKSLITNEDYLRVPSEEVILESKIPEILKDLEDSLDCKRGIGISAIQIGIPKKIGIVRLGEKHNIDLINPEIVDKDDKFKFYNEGCLSVPGIRVNTIRYNRITILNGIGENRKKYALQGLEAVAVQHEIDHMNGILIMDRKEKPFVRTEAKVGRNDLCPCGSGKKYKKCCGR